jgi:hypothetical protein
MFLKYYLSQQIFVNQWREKQRKMCRIKKYFKKEFLKLSSGRQKNCKQQNFLKGLERLIGAY